MEARRAARTADFVRSITHAVGRTVDRSAIVIGSSLRVALVGGVIFATGCTARHQTPSGPRASERPPEHQGIAQVADTGATDAPVPATPETLEQQARRYAESVESARAPRAAAQPQASTVEWPDPGDLSLAEESGGEAELPAETDSRPAAIAVVMAEAEKTAGRLAELAPTREVVSNDAVTDATPDAPSIEDKATLANAKLSVQSTDGAPEIAEEGPLELGPLDVGDDPMSKQFAARIKDNPRDVAGHLDYQLLRFLRDEQVPQLNVIASLPAEDRELVTALLDGLSNFRQTVRADNNLLLSKKIRPILDLADRLRSQADLHIPAVSLCRRVDGFGVYEPIDPPRFAAGKSHPMIVYCEIENFASQVNDQKQWETNLTQQAVLYTEGGLPVWEQKTKTIKDTSRNRRHDFYSVDMIKLPANLTIGRYILKVSVVDKQVHRVAESTLPIQIVAE